MRCRCDEIPKVCEVTFEYFRIDRFRRRVQNAESSLFMSGAFSATAVSFALLIAKMGKLADCAELLDCGHATLAFIIRNRKV
jgi:hypothetical protein